MSPSDSKLKSVSSGSSTPEIAVTKGLIDGVLPDLSDIEKIEMGHVTVSEEPNTDVLPILANSESTEMRSVAVSEEPNADGSTYDKFFLVILQHSFTYHSQKFMV